MEKFLLFGKSILKITEKWYNFILSTRRWTHNSGLHSSNAAGKIISGASYSAKRQARRALRRRRRLPLQLFRRRDPRRKEAQRWASRSRSARWSYVGTTWAQYIIKNGVYASLTSSIWIDFKAVIKQSP